MKRIFARIVVISLSVIGGLIFLAGYRVYRQVAFIDRWMAVSLLSVRTDHSGSDTLRSMVGNHWILGFERIEYVNILAEMPDGELAYIARKQVPEIDAQSRPLAGSFGELLGRNRGLETLTLAGGGAAEREFFEGLSRARSLKSLTLRSCEISGDALNPLAGMASLQEIDFACRMQNANFEVLRMLPNLKQLTIRSRLSLPQWHQVAAIDENAVELNVTNLGCADDDFVELAALVQFDSLVLITGDQITEKGLAALPLIRGLHSLELHGRAVRDDTISIFQELSELKSLTIFSNSVTDAGLPELYPLKDLNSLTLNYTHVTADGVRELRSRLPGVQVRTYPRFRN